MVFSYSVIVNSIDPVVVFMQDVFLFFLIKDECSFVYFLSKKEKEKEKSSKQDQSCLIHNLSISSVVLYIINPSD